MKTGVTVTGLRELDENLGQLSKATARNVLKRVLTRAGQPIANTASRLAPDDPATDAPDLHRSIEVSARVKNSAGDSAFAEAMRAGLGRAAAAGAMRDARRAAGGGSFAEMFVGVTGASASLAHLQEFGTDHHGPQPFMRPAYDQEKGNAVDIIRNDLGAEIDKAVKRMKRRQQKKASR